MSGLFDRFLRERQYLSNVTPRTLDWHKQSLAWLRVERPTQEDLRAFVLRMREAGLKASSCNCRIRSINAYLRWAASPLRVPKLKEEERLPPTYTAKQVSLIVRWKPRTFGQRRLHLLLLLLFDTGMRLEEALSLRVADCDLDNLLLTVTGKGRKQRIVPMSRELRRALALAVLDRSSVKQPEEFVLATKAGRRLGQRNTLRDVKQLCRALGFEPPRRTVHATRHTFAIEYLRRGGSVFHLQKMLGHTTLEMTRRYANLATQDLQAIHERVSLLNGGSSASPGRNGLRLPERHNSQKPGR